MSKNPSGVSLQAMMAKMAELEARTEAAEKRAAEAEKKAASGPQRAAGISMDKLGRMSVQLAGSVHFAFYLDQWDKFEPMIGEMKEFIKANRKAMPDEATRKAAAKARKANA